MRFELRFIHTDNEGIIVEIWDTYLKKSSKVTDDELKYIYKLENADLNVEQPNFDTVNLLDDLGQIVKIRNLKEIDDELYQIEINTPQQ